MLPTFSRALTKFTRSRSIPLSCSLLSRSGRPRPTKVLLTPTTVQRIDLKVGPRHPLEGGLLLGKTP